MIPRFLAHVRGNLVAYLALFVALSGTAVAATALPRNSVGTPQLKRGAVNASKVKRESLTGRQIRESSLGQVPLAGRSLRADSATTAGSAATASRALDAQTLGGQQPSAFLAAGGTAANADKLDGIDSSVFGTVVTYAGVDFEPRDSSSGTTKDYISTGSIACRGTSDDFMTPVHLPQGARITQLDYAYVDNRALTTNRIGLWGFDVFGVGGSLSTTSAPTAWAATADADRRVATTVLPTPHVVDNGRWAYELVWEPFGCGADLQLTGARIHYTLPTG